MKKIKGLKRSECFQELSKKEKQSISGGGSMLMTAYLREIVIFFAPRNNS